MSGFGENLPLNTSHDNDCKVPIPADPRPLVDMYEWRVSIRLSDGGNGSNVGDHE